jgi:hypothetical protein
VLINFLSLSVNGDHNEAHSLAPFLVRAKWSYEPELRPLEDDPGAPEWFAFDTLYTYQDTFFATEDGVLVTIKPHTDLLAILTDKQLSVIEDALRATWEDEANGYEPMLDYEYGI